MILGSLTLVLKIRFQFSSFATKKVQGFSSGRETIVIITLSSQNRVSILWIFFESFNLELRFLGKCTWCPWNQPHFLTKSNKSPYLLCKKKGNLRQFCRWTTAEGDNVKINLSSNIPLSFCSSKFVHFFKISFREKRVFKSCTIKWMECK